MRKTGSDDARYLCINMTKSAVYNEPVLFRDRLPGLLMIFSMALLLLLQFAWLRSAWHEEREAFRKETNNLLKSTIASMQDSLILRNVEMIQGDSVYTGRSQRYTHVRGDSTGMFETNMSIEVFFSSERGDSVRRIIKPLMRKMRGTPGHKRFFVRLGADSLDTDSVAIRYSDALLKSGIDLPFTVHRTERKGPGVRANPSLQSGGQFVSDPVHVSPVSYYTAAFSGTDAFFIQAITPEIFFCLFVTLLTSGSFLLMQRSIRSQRHLMKMKNEFISNITHELKTPVATVSVALEALERFEALDDKEKTKDYLGMAQDELNRLVLMIDKILQTASFENSAPDMKFERINLDDEIRGVLKSMKLVFERRQVRVRYTCQGTDFILSGSRGHLVTVLYNLVDNAIKYSPVSSTVSVRLEATDDTIRLIVEDSGIGIPQEYHKRIFDRFFRVPSGDVHNTKGYGLGLNYVAQVVSAHQGEIDVRSEERKGS
jgi:two-component system phosphate regulon sensor histidine kinase PhoR